MEHSYKCTTPVLMELFKGTERPTGHKRSQEERNVERQSSTYEKIKVETIGRKNCSTDERL